ncbi:uncharacterized protein LOC119107748 [Pollicipes pollicipes]|uniref:uncharacterized protein LOC119107748 n=1 Tax=Pollicipes pollicipes TaxID=41117 RepID=UPI00188587C0|nr:uncharacterized protein LOC119107748 [Pollicipes pollicipes]
MLHAAWPPVACLALLVVVVIVLILKYGHKCFGARVTTLPQPWERHGSQYQYQMDVLDTSARPEAETPLKQPLDPSDLIDTRQRTLQPDDSPEPGYGLPEPADLLEVRYGSRERMEIIEPTPRYASREAAV